MTETGIESDDIQIIERRYENALRILHINGKFSPRTGRRSVFGNWTRPLVSVRFEIFCATCLHHA